MACLPSLFISHGSPMLAIQPTPAHRFLRELGHTLPRPAGVIVASAHWESAKENGPAVSLAPHPETIHDFGGFPQALFDIRYPAPGAPEIAARAAALLEGAGFAVESSGVRGLDHGAWVPLSLMYPAADLPVTQVSILRDGTPADHQRIGRALRPLRDEGVLVIGSGSLTHNLSEFRGQAIDAPVPGWVGDFGDWMKERLEASDAQALLNYRREAPFAVRNHPTEEHLSPVFVAMGAAGDAPKARRLHGSHEYGVLAMDVYAFE